MIVKINGVRLAYSERGKEHGTALLLIHGFPLDRRLWARRSAGWRRRCASSRPICAGMANRRRPAGAVHDGATRR